MFQILVQYHFVDANNMMRIHPRNSGIRFLFYKALAIVGN